MTFKVYKYTFPNGKIYIGVTHNTIQYRKDCGYQHNLSLTKALRECGWAAVKVDILADGLTEDEAFEKEQAFISEYHANDSAIGFNISAGGRCTFKGLKHTKQHREYMSRLYMGRTFSQETLKRMKEAHAGERCPVKCLNDNKEVVKTYVSLHEAAESVNGYPTNIKRSCDSGKPYKGYLWETEGGDLGEALR